MKVFQTNYAADIAAGSSHDPVWAGNYQSPSGMITLGTESDGLAYQQQRCVPGSNWNGMQRADVLTNLLNPAIQEGGEWAAKLRMKLAPNFTAPNPGWCVGGAEIHDVRGAVGMAILAAQSFAAGEIQAEEFASVMYAARTVAGEEHLARVLAEPWQDHPYAALASVGTQANISMLVSENGLQLRVLGGDISTTSGAPISSADTFYSARFPLARGAYHDVVFYCLHSADRTKGHVKLMIDGQVVIDQTCATIYTGSSGYLKQPFYRDPNQPANVDTWIRYGDELACSGPGCWTEVQGTTSAPPTLLSAPVVSGQAEVEQTLSCSTGSWGNTPTGFTYQWQRNSQNLIGETSNALLLDASDQGGTVRCVVTASNASGSGTGTSNAVGPVVAAPVTNVQLRDEAIAHLKATTISYPSWQQRVNQGRYTPPDGSATEWGQALALLAQIT